MRGREFSCSPSRSERFSSRILCAGGTAVTPLPSSLMSAGRGCSVNCGTALRTVTNPRSEGALPVSALQHLGQMVLVSGCLWIQSLTLFFCFLFSPVCKPCPQSALTTGRISTWKVQPCSFTAEQALKGSISAVTGRWLFSSTIWA